ncbi:MAG TPA: hypothetical protein VK866_03985 [Acidimicrobiales bacterium]|nr:hypothetical protein [Acidimicrobiales bacterium]
MGIFRRRERDEAADAVVDVRADTEIDLRSESTTPPAVWGLPTRCPACGDFGYLDRIDVVNEVMLQHCPTCWHKWETHRSETTSSV